MPMPRQDMSLIAVCSPEKYLHMVLQCRSFNVPSFLVKCVTVLEGFRVHSAAGTQLDADPKTS